MPTKGSPASSDKVPEWRQRLKADLGEDPGRFLDRRLTSRPACWTLIDDEEYGGRSMERQVDTDVSTSGQLVIARIRGIDHLDRVRVWIAVERRLDRGPRDPIIELLEEREAELEAEGERELPGLTPAQRRQAAAAIATESNAVFVDREGGTRNATFVRERQFDWSDDASGEGSA